MSRKRSFRDVSTSDDDDGGITSGKPLIHRSRLEMMIFLRDRIKGFPNELLDCILDYMVNHRMLVIINPTVYQFSAVWYDLFGNRSAEGYLIPILEQSHSSQICVDKLPQGPVFKR